MMHSLVHARHMVTRTLLCAAVFALVGLMFGPNRCQAAEVRAPNLPCVLQLVSCNACNPGAAFNRGLSSEPQPFTSYSTGFIPEFSLFNEAHAALNYSEPIYYVLSAYHAVSEYLRIFALFDDDPLGFDGTTGANTSRQRQKNPFAVNGFIEFFDQEQDIAIISIELTAERGTPYCRSGLSFARGYSASFQERLYTIGNKLGLGISAVPTTISAVRKCHLGERCYYLESSLSYGSSGSPILNAEGQVVSMANSILEGDSTPVNIAFGLPASELLHFVDSFHQVLRVEGYIFGEAKISRNNLQFLSVPSSSNFRIYDTIKKVNGNRVSSISTFRAELARAIIMKQNVRLGLTRDEKSTEIVFKINSHLAPPPKPARAPIARGIRSFL